MRSYEARLRKLEQSRPGRYRPYEEWLEILDREPPLTEAESAALDAEIEAEAIGEFGSLRAAAARAVRERASRTCDPWDDFTARDLEVRAEDEETHNAHA